MDRCDADACPTSSTASLTVDGVTADVSPANEMVSSSTSTLPCQDWSSGFTGSITLSCLTGTVSVVSNTCTAYDACSEGTDDCVGTGAICEMTGPGTHSCTCPVNSYGTATAVSEIQCHPKKRPNMRSAANTARGFWGFWLRTKYIVSTVTVPNVPNMVPI